MKSSWRRKRRRRTKTCLHWQQRDSSRGRRREKEDIKITKERTPGSEEEPTEWETTREGSLINFSFPWQEPTTPESSLWLRWCNPRYPLTSFSTRLRFRRLRLRSVPGNEAAEDPARVDETGAGEFRQEGGDHHQERWGSRQNKGCCCPKGKSRCSEMKWLEFLSLFFWVCCASFLLSPHQMKMKASDFGIFSLSRTAQELPEQSSIKDSPRKPSGSPKHKGGNKGQGTGKKEKKASVSSPVSESARFGCYFFFNYSADNHFLHNMSTYNIY